MLALDPYNFINKNVTGHLAYLLENIAKTMDRLKTIECLKEKYYQLNVLKLSTYWKWIKY